MSEPRRKRECSYLIGNKFAAGQPPNSTSFNPGHVPWNKGLKGFSPAGSERGRFKAGQRGIKWVPVGTERVRKDKGSGARRMYVKVAEPRKWRLRAVLVWEAAHGAIPKGLVLHHRDEDALHDELHNLQLLTRAEHLKVHEKTLRKAAKESPKRMGWGPGGKRVEWRRSWMQLEVAGRTSTDESKPLPKQEALL